METIGMEGAGGIADIGINIISGATTTGITTTTIAIADGITIDLMIEDIGKAGMIAIIATVITVIIIEIVAVGS